MIKKKKASKKKVAKKPSTTKKAAKKKVARKNTEPSTRSLKLVISEHKEIIRKLQGDLSAKQERFYCVKQSEANLQLANDSLRDALRDAERKLASSCHSSQIKDDKIRDLEQEVRDGAVLLKDKSLALESIENYYNRLAGSMDVIIFQMDKLSKLEKQ